LSACLSVPDNVILIGFSGTGKSTVAKRLAKSLGWSYVDTDEQIVATFGKSIAAVFREDGETTFRAVERDAVIRACRGARQVISVGGGAPVDPVGRHAMRDGNVIVRLHATPETIFLRLRQGQNAEERPMVAGADPLSRIRSLLQARTEAYGIADVSVDTEGCAPEEVANQICDWLAERTTSIGRPGGES
jgi:shikimate kinase